MEVVEHLLFDGVETLIVDTDRDHKYPSIYWVTLQGIGKDPTVKEYETWSRSPVYNCLDMSFKHPPQELRPDMFHNAYKIEDICNEAFKDIQKHFDIKVDDVVAPFIGGIHGYDFRDLYAILIRQKNLWRMRQAIKDYVGCLIIREAKA